MQRRTTLRGSNHGRPARTRSTRPTLELLEDRQLLSSVEGGQWTYASRITYSFIPDGTSLGGVSSNLFKTMNAVAPTASWEQAIEKAAALWETATGVNLALVSDNGQAFGTGPDQQGDPNVGDIRIGAMPLQSNVLALAMLPPPANGGSDAGDIIFNSNMLWQVNSNYDIETVALHEFGHALGLGHSTVSTAVMNAYYTSVKQTLDPDDVSGIQGIYGAPQADTVSNSSSSTATDLTPLLANNQAALGGQYTTGVPDYDWFKVTVPAGSSGPMTVTMQSTGLSSLSPRLAVYNGGLQGLAQVTAANVYGATVNYTVANVSPGQVYYFRCSAANTGAGTNGAYGVEVKFGTGYQAPVAPPNTLVLAQPDQGGGSSGMQTGPQAAGPRESLAVPDAAALQVGNLVVLGDALTVGRNVGPVPSQDRGDSSALPGIVVGDLTDLANEGWFSGWPNGKNALSFLRPGAGTSPASARGGG